VVRQHAGEGHRHPARVGRGEGEPHVLQAEAQLEARRLVAFLGDHPAVGLVQGRLEQVAAHDLQEPRRLDAALPEQRVRLAERLDHRDDQEVAAELQGRGRDGIVAQHVELAADALQRLTRALDRRRGARGDHHQLLRGGGVRAAEDGRGDEVLAGPGVGIGQAPRHRRADRAQRDVDGAPGERRQHAPLAEHHGFDGRVVRQHGQDYVGAARLGDRLRDVRAPAAQLPVAGARAGPVVGRDLVARLQQAPHDGQTHGTEADKPELHALPSLQ
jgi:hypothetical protein